MRVSGSLFTYAELSASIADLSFEANDTPITTPNNKIVTVQDAQDMVVIYPLNGPDNRLASGIWRLPLTKVPGESVKSPVRTP